MQISGYPTFLGKKNCLKSPAGIKIEREFHFSQVTQRERPGKGNLLEAF